MAVFTDADIEKILCDTENWVSPEDTLWIYPCGDDSLTPVGYDLRVGDQYSSSSRPGPRPLSQGESLPIRPGETVLVKTLESVGMPRNGSLSGLICSKVSVVAQGLSHISTTIDADWRGELLLAINNNGNATVHIKFGQEIATAVFLENQSKPTREAGHPPGRSDIILAQWAEVFRKTRMRDQALFWLRPALVLSAFGIGLTLFGNAPGTTAAVAAGVAVSQLLPRGHR